jgi:membrane protein
MNKIQRIILELAPVQFVVDKSKKIVLPGFDGVPLYDVVAFFIEEVRKEGLNERASAIAFNFIMAIPPTCLFLFSLIPHLPFLRKMTIQRQLTQMIKDIIPAKEHNTNIIRFIVSFFEESRIGLLSFGFLMLIFFASNGMMGLMHSFNKDYIGFSRRTALRTRWIALKLTIIIMGLLLGCLILLIMQGAVMDWLGIRNSGLKLFLNYFRWIFMLGLIFYTFAFIYKYGPAVTKRWKLVSPGSILGSVLSILGTWGFSYFVNNFGRYNALYGSIGTVIVLMILIYINSLILLIGYELNASIHSIKALAEERAMQEKKKVGRTANGHN